MCICIGLFKGSMSLTGPCIDLQIKQHLRMVSFKKFESTDDFCVVGNSFSVQYSMHFQARIILTIGAVDKWGVSYCIMQFPDVYTIGGRNRG